MATTLYETLLENSATRIGAITSNISQTENIKLLCHKHALTLISNNPHWAHADVFQGSLTQNNTNLNSTSAPCIDASKKLTSSSKKHIALEMLESNALDVLIMARDYIHVGWKLLNHPLYGNFCPYQQPFRSLLLQRPQKEGCTSQSSVSASSSCDPFSLHLIEQALAIYHESSYPLMERINLHASLINDCAILDMALLEATLESNF